MPSVYLEVIDRYPDNYRNLVFRETLFHEGFYGIDYFLLEHTRDEVIKLFVALKSFKNYNF